MFLNLTIETTTIDDTFSTMAFSELNDSSTDSLQDSQRDISSYLDKLNQEFTKLVLLAIVYLVILMVIGIIGNGLVLYVYTYKTKTGTITRYIQALAVFDLLSCCFAMPGEIADMSQNYTFGSNPVCKVVRTVNLFCTMASGVTLVVVAVDRYKRICSPFKDQITPRGAYTIVIICSCISAVLSLPSAAIFGSRSIPTRWDFVNGTDCSISDQFIDTAVPLLYNSFQMLLFVVGAIIISILYFFIGRTIFRQAHLRRVRARRSSVIQPINGHISSTPVSDPSTHSSQDSSSPETVAIDKNRPLNPKIVIDDKVCDTPDLKTSFPKRFHNRFRKDVKSASSEQSNNRNSNGKFVEIELSSNTTVSPPETPIDQQMFDYRPLIKSSLSKTSNAHYKQNHSKPNNSEKKNSPCNLEQLDEQTLNDSIIAKNSLKIESNDKLCTNGANIKEEIISCNLSGFKNVTDIEENEDNQKSKTQNSSLINSKDAKTSCENAGAPQCNSKGNNPKSASPIECSNNNNILERLKLPLAHHDGDSGFGETGSQEKLRWSTTMMTTQSSTAIIPGRAEELFRSNSDVGRRVKGGKYRREPTKRKVTSDDEGDSRRRRMIKNRGSSHGRMRRHSSFKRFRDLKKLSISDPHGTRRTTLMLFLISLIYVISFLPHLLLMIIKVTHPTSLSGEGGSIEVAHNILLRSYFINSVANPIIYSFCSRDFFTRCLSPRGADISSNHHP